MSFIDSFIIKVTNAIITLTNIAFVRMIYIGPFSFSYFNRIDIDF